MTLPEYLLHQQKRVDAALDRWVAAESQDPSIIHQAMRYSLFAGGKRIRPLLAMAAAAAVSDDVDQDPGDGSAEDRTGPVVHRPAEDLAAVVGRHLDGGLLGRGHGLVHRASFRGSWAAR